MGAGRLGRVLATAIPARYAVTILSRRAGVVSRTGQPDLPVGTDPAIAGDADLVLLALPASEIVPVMSRLTPHLSRKVLIANLATGLPTRDLTAVMTGHEVIACKVVGQSGRIAEGVRAVLAVPINTPTQHRSLLADVLGAVGEIVELDEEAVVRINELVARRMSDAYTALREGLAQLAVPAAVADAAVRNLAVGILDVIARGTPGPFLQRMLRDGSRE